MSYMLHYDFGIFLNNINHKFLYLLEANLIPKIEIKISAFEKKINKQIPSGGTC